MSGRDGGTGEGARLVAHPEPGKVWVQIPHRNDIGNDWIAVDELPTSDADPASTSASEVEALADLLMDGADLADGFGYHDLDSTDARRRGCKWIAEMLLASDWLRDREAAAATRGRAEGWDEREKAKPQYLGPDGGHYPDDCMGWEDCRCASYSNPYRADSLDPAPRGDGAGA